MTSVGKNIENRVYCWQDYKLVLAIVENTMEVPQKAKNKPIIPYGPTIPLLVKYPHKTTKRYMHTNTDSSIIYKSQDTEKTLILGKIEGGRRGDNRGWDGWMTSPTHWTWVWVNSRS